MPPQRDFHSSIPCVLRVGQTVTVRRYIQTYLRHVQRLVIQVIDVNMTSAQLRGVTYKLDRHRLGLSCCMPRSRYELGLPRRLGPLCYSTDSW